MIQTFIKNLPIRLSSVSSHYYSRKPPDPLSVVEQSNEAALVALFSLSLFYSMMKGCDDEAQIICPKKEWGVSGERHMSRKWGQDDLALRQWVQLALNVLSEAGRPIVMAAPINPQVNALSCVWPPLMRI